MTHRVVIMYMMKENKSVAEDKQTRVRHWLLDHIDGGELRGGDKLPGARDISSRLDVSLLTTQNAIETLVNEGVLESYPRRGTFVAAKWRECLLQYNFRANNPVLPWLKDIKAMTARILPRLYFAAGFDSGMIELRPTLVVQSCRNEYMDMRELFDRCFPDRADFFMEAFNSYYSSDGSLPGVPFIFSPRVMYYNRELLAQAGCPEPHHNWSWKDFIDSMGKLKNILPGERIFNWNYDKHQWLGFIFRAGGRLFAPEDKLDPVRIDHPDTRRGLRLFRELQELLEPDGMGASEDYRREFGRGRCAFMLAPREDLYFIKREGFDNWGTVPMPEIPGGKQLTTQAADLICIRKSCSNLKMAEDFLKLMLSESVQKFIGDSGYGIPIRKSAAENLIHSSDPREKTFIGEIPHMSAQYNIDSIEIMNLVLDGVNQMWENNADIDAFTSELAAAVRTFMKIKNAVSPSASSVPPLDCVRRGAVAKCG